MIKEAYCSFEVSKLLKEKGFDVYGDGSFGSNTEIHREYLPNGKTINTLYGAKPHKDAYPAPTHQMAMAWLREICDLIIYVKLVNDGDPCHDAWGFVIYNKFTNEYIKSDKLWFKYEEATEAALKYSLKNLI